MNVILHLGALASIITLIVVLNHDYWERMRAVSVERRLNQVQQDVTEKLAVAQGKTETALLALQMLLVGRLDDHETRIHNLETPGMEGIL